MLALAFTACTQNEHRAQGEQQPIKVSTMVVASQTANAASRYVGTIEPVHETPLSMHTTGRVVAINVKNGQRVRKGQTLLAVDNTQAINALRGAEAALQQAQDGYNRVSKVHDKGVVSDQKMVEIESKLAQAKSMHAAAKRQVEECTLTAPCDGVVDGLKIEKGQSVVPGVTLCSILDLSGFSVRFTVPETEISELSAPNVKLTGTVECTAIDSVFPIVVTEKSVTANTVTHTFEVVAKIKGGADVLMSGMVGKVELKVERGESKVESEKSRGEGIVIPARCVLLKPEGHTVWVVEQGTAVRRFVTVEGYQADGVKIVKGLQSGDTLITDGYQKLYKDCKVIEN